MELHRLQPFNYESEVFNKIYKETEPLRKKLAGQINTRLFGVSYDIVLSWFDDKFLHAYSKYYEKHPDGSEGNLKGYIINSLQIFKLRVLRKAYQEGIYHDMVTIDDNPMINYLPDKNDLEEGEVFLERALGFLKSNLSDIAYSILQLELNPPPYIMVRMDDPKKKIPIPLMLEFLNIPESPENIRLIQLVRREIKNGIVKAKSHFLNKLELSLY
jgi:hypothetical protein